MLVSKVGYKPLVVEHEDCNLELSPVRPHKPLRYTDIDLSRLDQSDIAVITIFGLEEPFTLDTSRRMIILKMVQSCRALKIPIILAVEQTWTNMSVEKLDELNHLLFFTRDEVLVEDLEYLPLDIVVVSAKDNVGIDNDRRNCFDESLLDIVKNIPKVFPSTSTVFRLPVMKAYQKQGLIRGRILSGSISSDQEMRPMPSNVVVAVEKISSFGKNTAKAGAGEVVKIWLRGLHLVPEEGILCNVDNPCSVATIFEAKIYFLGVVKDVSMEAGCLMFMYNLGNYKDVSIEQIFNIVWSGTETSVFAHNRLRPGQEGLARIKVCHGPVCAERYSDCPQLGQFILKDGIHHFLIRGEIQTIIQ